MDIESVFQPERTTIVSQGIIDITAGQYLQIRHGLISSPVVDLQESCPEGKKWTTTINLTIVETNA